MNTWTQFMDMHSGGRTKVEPYNYIYIEAPGDIAAKVFETKFGREPTNVTCECCGEDYWLSSGSIEQVTGYNRGCLYSKEAKAYLDEPDPYYSKLYTTLEDYKKRPDVLFIYKKDL